jgi:type II secretory pathway pseudopilin PulG
MIEQIRNTKMHVKRNSKSELGITLIALVITIIILIILATISITLVFGEGGLIQRAQEGKALTEQAQKDEQDELKGAEEFINGVLAGTDLPDNPEDEPYVDGSIVVAPQISSGMTPVKYDENQNKWVKTEVTDSEWYDYGNKEWANVVLVGENGKDADGDQDVFNADGTLNEDSNYSMLVWIPRYAYKINSQYHESGTGGGEIDIVFLDTDNKGKDRNTTYSTEYPSVSGGAMSDYVVHPAFDYGGTALPGFWVGKFESSHIGCTTDSSTGEYTKTDKILQIKAGITSWRKINISNIFTVCTAMNDIGNPYGLNTSDNVVDPHMMKNSEWGAVAYLSQNATYGKGSEVWTNNSRDFITGSAGNSASAAEGEGTTNDYKSTQGQEASTTGNVTGIYDMSGGAWEYVAAYINNDYIKSGQDPYSYGGKNLIDSVNAGNTKYADIYKVTLDNELNNYNDAQPTANQGNPTSSTGYYGDAIWETSKECLSSNGSWYEEGSRFPNTNYPFFDRGGGIGSATSEGLFYFSYNNGYTTGQPSFRVVIPVIESVN